MELSWPLVFKIGMSLAGFLTVIGTFSELSWPVKFKVTATLLIGIILTGFLVPSRTPNEPFGIVSMPAFSSAVYLAGLAILTGFLGNFISWPYGREIGIIAIPAGLAVWSTQCGNIADLIRSNPTLAQRQAMFTAMAWEPFFWLAIVAAGFGGVLIGRFLVCRPGSSVQRSSVFRLSSLIRYILAVVGSVLIAQFCIGILAQDIRIPDPALGSVVAQPTTGQIVFAVLVSFGIAGFIVKKFLNAHYIWPMVASALVTGFTVITSFRQQTFQLLIEHHPPSFFANAVISILPAQIVSFGVLGSIAGYWLAVRYNFWQKHPEQ